MKNLKITVNGVAYSVQVEEVSGAAAPAAPAAAPAPAPVAAPAPPLRHRPPRPPLQLLLHPPLPLRRLLVLK